MPEKPGVRDRAINGVPTTLDITTELRAACESILPPVIEMMIDLISRVSRSSRRR